MTQLYTVVASAIALVFGITTFFAISATAGEPEAQKMFYVSHELAYLIRASALLPENSNYLLPDSLEGATAELLQGRLIVQGATTRTPELIIPEFVETADTKVNVDFLYVSKIDDTISLSSVRNDACLKLDNGAIQNSRIRINAEFYNEQQEKILNEIKENFKDRLERFYDIKEGGSLIINLKLGSKEEILVNNAVNREHSSLSCFISKATKFQIRNEDEALEGVTVSISQNTDVSSLITKLVNALEEFYE